MQDKIIKIAEDIFGLAPQIITNLQNGFKDSKLNQLSAKPRNSLKSGIQDVTTKLDHDIGKLFIEKIYKKYTEDITIDSEEESERVGSGKIILRFDPVDGSKHLVQGFPQIACAATLVYNAETLFGMVIDPFTANTYHSLCGKGSYLNSKKIIVNNNSISDDLSFVMYEAPNSNVYTKSREEFTHSNTLLTSLQKTAYRTRNIGSSTLSICYVADGTSPLFIDFSGTTKFYDVEASVLIAKEAGAKIGTTNGKDITNLEYNKESVKKTLTGNLLIGNPKAWRETVELLNN